MHAEMRERRENFFGGAGNGARRIHILDAHTIQLPPCARASRKLASALTSEACSGPVGEGPKAATIGHLCGSADLRFWVTSRASFARLIKRRCL